jgi:GNAT superfamily N-acetyltransferase
MIIRKALPEEASCLSELAFRSKAYWPYDKTLLLKYCPNLQVDEEDILAGVVYVGIIDKKIIGFYGLSQGSNLNRLYFLFVEPEFIGQGYGKKLWDHAILNAKNKGWPTLTFFADEYAVNKFYQYMPCKIIGNLKTDLGILTEMQVKF